MKMEYFNDTALYLQEEIGTGDSMYLNSTSTAHPGNESIDLTCFILNDPHDVMISHKISLFSCLSFVIVGIIGNTLSIVVFTNKTMRGASSNWYLFILAVSDSMYLVSVFFTSILKTMRCLYFIQTAMDIINRSSFLCKFFQFSSDFFSDYSTVLILLFTIERVVAVYLPIRFKELCTVARARIACLAMFAFIAVFIGPYHFLLMGKHVDVNGTEYNYCTVITMEKERPFMIMYVTECLLFRIIPVFAIAILNVFIIVKVTKMARDHRKRVTTSKAVAKANRRSKKDDKNVQLTIMLILVSTSYVLVYIPELIHFVLNCLLRAQTINISKHHMLIAENYTKSLYVSGFAINFFLYTVSGRVFREQLQLILCFKRSEQEKNGYTKTTQEDCMSRKHNGI